MVSEKLGNIASAGGGLIIFFVTVILLGFMTDEYNKGKKFEALKSSYDSLKSKCNGIETQVIQPTQETSSFIDDRCKYAINWLT